VEFVSNRMSYIILRCRWCDIIFLKNHDATEHKIDNVKDSFYKEVELVFDKFHKYHMKILLGEIILKVGRKDIFKPTNRNESLHEICNYNGVKSSKVRHIQKSYCQKYNVLTS
jgi:hypothetical protein